MSWAALLHVRTFQEIVVGIQLEALGQDLSAKNLSRSQQEALMSTSEVRHMRPTARPSTCEVGQDQRSVFIAKTSIDRQIETIFTETKKMKKDENCGDTNR